MVFADAFVCLWLLVVCGVASGWGVFLLVNFCLVFSVRFAVWGVVAGVLLRFFGFVFCALRMWLLILLLCFRFGVLLRFAFGCVVLVICLRFRFYVGVLVALVLVWRLSLFGVFGRIVVGLLLCCCCVVVICLCLSFCGVLIVL